MKGTKHGRRGGGKRLAWVAGASALVMAAGCGGSGGGSGNVSLRMYASPAVKEGLDPIVKEFNDANAPRIKMTVQYVPAPKIGPATTTELQGGNPPDILNISPGSGGGATGLPLYKLAKAKRLEDLSVKPWARNGVPPLLAPTITYDGKVYALLVGVSTHFMDYTVTDLKKWNLQPPATFADLLKLCGEIRKHGTYALVPGAADQAGNRMLLQAFSGANVYSVDPKWDDKRAAGQVKFQTSPGWRQTFQQIVDMINADCYYPGGAGRTTAAGKDLQIKGNKAVMGIGPSTASSFVTSRNPARKWAAVPVPGRKQSILPLEVSGLSAAARGEHVEESVKFLDFVAQRRDVYADKTGAISPAQMQRGELPDFLKPLEPLAKQNAYSLGAGTMWPSDAPAQAAYKVMAGLYNKTRTVDDILKAMDEAWDAS
ncbi:ABC-type glycerol-3-phosphate transport system substrate-binding protein [Actinomadura pelletieri DSM 43383]|uniref:ABC-type glycerol-3-phosphate transport system substrate-binding protein n=1 Tax=Actinomadura pelletieri DSM 43383 TaxID=1120940 RepID=A0A495QTX2_9ACTN|nr:extracellular solute-binding protein [Actinomadura pelletieri]RKS76966.1 ABC-type glycerol-3-phosphate transport system substrate-binding protein [Actinomadura pelletieri DSM 43383]